VEPTLDPLNTSSPVASSGSHQVGRGGRTLPWLLVLLLLAALGGGSWLGYQQWQLTRQTHASQQALFERLSSELQTLRAQAGQLATRVDDSVLAQQRVTEESASLRTRVDQTGEALSQLGATVQGGRGRIQLGAVEQVLLMANDRALLAHDAAGAAAALAQADERLAALKDPLLFKVREAIAHERAALLAMPAVDVTAVALSLSGLAQRLPQLPLRARAAHYEAEARNVEPPGEASTWPLRLWRSLKQALHAVFIIRHNETTVARLLPPEEEALVVQLAQLKLEGAKLALLRGETATFRDFCASVNEWLGLYFRADDAGVHAAQAELGRLRGLELSPQLPDISGSLKLLRAQLAATP
jgi:uroporphyrin-3 C-methyltransferase